MPTAFRSINSQPVAVSDNAGGFFTLFKSQRGAGGFSNLFLAHVTVQGQTPLAADGVAVCPRPAHQDAHSLVFDPAAGLYAAWQERKPDGMTSVYVQRLNHRAEPMWPSPGLEVSATPCPKTQPRILPDRLGGVYVVYEAQTPTLGKEVYAQRLDSAGKRLWGENGIVVASGTSNQQNVQLAPAPPNQLIVVWEDFRAGDSFALFAQKITSDGSVAWPASGVALKPPDLERIRYPAMFGDGFGGLIGVFEGMGLQTQGADIFAVHVNRRGELGFQKQLVAAPADQLRPQILQKGSDAMIIWEDHRNGQADIFAQRMDIHTGAPVWDSAGLPMCKAHQPQRRPLLVSSSVFGNQVAAWLDERLGSPMLFTQKLDKTGKGLWQENGQRLANLGTHSRDFAIVEDERGGAWFVWTEDLANSVSGLAFQHINEHGNPLFLEAKSLLRGQATGYANQLDELATCTQPEFNSTYLAWEDYRNGPKDADIYVQRLKADGLAAWRHGGVVACVAPGNQEVPVLLPMPTGVVVGWLDRRNARDDNLYLQFIDTAGRTRWTLDGLPLCVAQKSQTDLQLLKASDTSFYAVWTDTRHMDNSGFDIFMQLMTLQGRSLWALNGMALVRENGYQTGADICQDGKGGLFAAWMDDRADYYNIYLQHILPSGELSYGMGGKSANLGRHHQRAPVVQPAGLGGVAVAWADDRQGTLATHIRGQIIDYKANTKWQTTGIPLVPVQGARQSEPQWRALPGGGFVLAWLDERASASLGFQLYLQRLDAIGNQQWATGGVGIGQNMHNNNPFSMLLNGGSVFLAWTETVDDLKRTQWAEIGLASGSVLKSGLVAGDAQHVQPKLIRLPCARVALAWIAKRDDASHQLLLSIID